MTTYIKKTPQFFVGDKRIHTTRISSIEISEIKTRFDGDDVITTNKSVEISKDYAKITMTRSVNGNREVLQDVAMPTGGQLQSLATCKLLEAVCQFDVELDITIRYSVSSKRKTFFYRTGAHLEGAWARTEQPITVKFA